MLGREPTERKFGQSSSEERAEGEAYFTCGIATKSKMRRPVYCERLKTVPPTTPFNRVVIMKKFILYRQIAALIGGFFVFIEGCLYNIATNPDNNFWLVRLKALPLEIMLVIIIYKLREKSLEK